MDCLTEEERSYYKRSGATEQDFASYKKYVALYEGSPLKPVAFGDFLLIRRHTLADVEFAHTRKVIELEVALAGAEQRRAWERYVAEHGEYSVRRVRRG